MVERLTGRERVCAEAFGCVGCFVRLNVNGVDWGQFRLHEAGVVGAAACYLPDMTYAAVVEGDGTECAPVRLIQARDIADVRTGPDGLRVLDIETVGASEARGNRAGCRGPCPGGTVPKGTGQPVTGN